MAGSLYPELSIARIRASVVLLPRGVLKERLSWSVQVRGVSDSHDLGFERYCEFRIGDVLSHQIGRVVTEN
jgi:hypothetical protein